MFYENQQYVVNICALNILKLIQPYPKAMLYITTTVAYIWTKVKSDLGLSTGTV